MFLLAQANFKNTTARRYGPDHFDQRMKAVSHAKISGSHSSTGPNLEVESELLSTESGRDQTANPLRWFGILIPQQLRTCQRDFLALITGPVESAIDASRELRQLEVDIRRLRKERRRAERAGVEGGGR